MRPAIETLAIVAIFLCGAAAFLTLGAWAMVTVKAATGLDIRFLFVIPGSFGFVAFLTWLSNRGSAKPLVDLRQEPAEDPRLRQGPIRHLTRE